MKINIQITEIDRPHCMGCGSYCKPDVKGKSINLPHGRLVACDDCYSQLVYEMLRKEKLNLETKKDGNSLQG